MFSLNEILHEVPKYKVDTSNVPIKKGPIK